MPFSGMRQRVLDVGCLLLALASWCTAQNYGFVEINYPGMSNTFANGVNSRGDIVGTANNSIGYWLHEGHFTALNFPTAVPPNGWVATQANGINNRGEIVGGYQTSTGTAEGWVFQNGRYQSIVVLGAQRTFALGINNKGQILGSFDVVRGDAYEIYAYVLSKNVFTTFSALGAGGQTFATSINDRGEIVGSFVNHGFFRSAKGSVLFIDFPNASATSLSAINNQGTMVGSYLDKNGLSHGFVLRNGKLAAFDFPGGQETYPKDINEAGEIVGIYRNAVGELHGFEARPESSGAHLSQSR